MKELDNPAVLQETHITLASVLHSGGESGHAAVLRFRALQRDSAGHLEEVVMPTLLLERAVLQELIEGLQRTLERLGGPMETVRPAQGLQ